jgi:hypothetical protein
MKVLAGVGSLRRGGPEASADWTPVRTIFPSRRSGAPDYSPDDAIYYRVVPPDAGPADVAGEVGAGDGGTDASDDSFALRLSGSVP